MGDPGNPQHPTGPGSEPDPEQPGWASPNPPPPPDPTPQPTPQPPPVNAPPAAPTPAAQPAWGTPAPAWGAPPPGGPIPPAGGYGAGPPVKKRRLTWLWILIPTLLVLVASTVVVGVYVGELVLGPVDSTNDFLADVRAERYEEAYASLCAPARRVITEADFIAQQQESEQTRGPIVSYDINDFEINDDSDAFDFDVDDDFADATIDATTSGTVVRGSSEYDLRATLRREAGDWRVCSVVERP